MNILYHRNSIRERADRPGFSVVDVIAFSVFNEVKINSKRKKSIEEEYRGFTIDEYFIYSITPMPVAKKPRPMMPVKKGPKKAMPKKGKC